MKVEPYLFFEGRCEEAIDFYRAALGAELLFLMRYKESPEPMDPSMVPPGSGEKVMHASLLIGNTKVMVSDGNCQGPPSFHGFSLSVEAEDQAEATRLFGALADGGEVCMPLTKTFFAASFGMVTDRFGVMWMVMVESEPKT